MRAIINGPHRSGLFVFCQYMNKLFNLLGVVLLDVKASHLCRPDCIGNVNIKKQVVYITL